MSVTAHEMRRPPTVRRPAVAGSFYPADCDALRRMVTTLLDRAETDALPPKALIAPHAGYLYSGPVAASVYARLRKARDSIRRVVLLGPAHRVGFYGLAAPDEDWFETPLGRIPVDIQAIERAVALPTVFRYGEAHRPEHSLEVQLPFLQMALGEFSLVPLVVGSAIPEEVAEVIDLLWGGDETLIVVSSDLSHYLDYDTARRMDATTSESIVSLHDEILHPGQACGYLPIQGLLRVAREHGLRGELVDLRNSGDTSGPREQVVGYGAYAFS